MDTCTPTQRVDIDLCCLGYSSANVPLALSSWPVRPRSLAYACVLVSMRECLVVGIFPVVSATQSALICCRSYSGVKQES